jgi:hypothetical protein
VKEGNALAERAARRTWASVRLQPWREHKQDRLLFNQGDY